MGKKENKILRLILIIIWMLVVFVFSNQPAKKSSEISGEVTEKVNILIFNTKNTIFKKKLEKIIRKVAHYEIYILGGLLIINLIYIYKFSERKTIIVSTILGSICASLDEIHQLFIDGRSCQITDILLDTLGVITGAMMYLLIVKIIKLRKR